MSAIGSLVERVLTFVLVLLLSPVFLVVALMVLCRDGSPVIFKQIRVGLAGRPFEILKFRTMSNSGTGPLITGSGDPRVTANGALLRRTKLDELPQLWNVVRGDMRLVGPRPEVPKYVEDYTDDERRVLDSKPGITGVASLAFRDEETLLAEADDPARLYVEQLMPAKILMNLEYARQRSIFTDMKVILDTFLAVGGWKKTNPPEGITKAELDTDDPGEANGKDSSPSDG